MPSCLDPGSQFAGAAEFESFGEVVHKANSWVRQQQNVRVTNVQSIDYKVRHGAGNEGKCCPRGGVVSSKLTVLCILIYVAIAWCTIGVVVMS